MARKSGPQPPYTLPVRGSTVRGPRRFRRLRIEVLGGSGKTAQGPNWSEPRDRCSIGSHPSNDLVLADPTVSRFHCEVAADDDRCRLLDLGSRNGTLVGEVQVTDGTVASGAVLTLGRTRVRVALEAGEEEAPASASPGFGSLVGSSAAIREVFAQLERAAASDATVLLEGETGTGKEGAAEALHAAGARADGPFIVVDCGAIPPTLLEAELFGHEQGAFTGAGERRIGAFEEASGGTLFLDEIGELPSELQPKLLRVLETRQIRRIGSRTPIDCDVRVVAATNRDLRAEVNDGGFRADLYYRVAVVRITLPPLRGRVDDLPLLVGRLLERLDADPETKAALSAPEFIEALARAAWPGNVRELRNHLEQCLVFREARLPEPGPSGAARGAVEVDPTVPYETARRRALESFERDYVRALVAHADGNVARAAREAGMNRAYLYRLLGRYRLKM
jgi:two-component system, NtrC family, response regulator GlrR